MRFCNVAESRCGKVTLTLFNVNETCPEFCCVRRCLDVKRFALYVDKTHGRGKYCCPHIHKPLWLLNKPLGLLSGSTCLAICLYSGQMVLKPLSDFGHLSILWANGPASHSPTMSGSLRT